MTPTRTFQRTALCISIQHVSPQTWALCNRWLQAIHAVAKIPVTLVLVPPGGSRASTLSSNYEHFLVHRLRSGDELALHAYAKPDAGQPSGDWLRRLVPHLFTIGDAETHAAGLKQARIGLQNGRAWFAQRQWPAFGFAAPPWLMADPAWNALGDFKFRYATTRRRFFILPERCALPAQLVAGTVRSAWWRRMAQGCHDILGSALLHAPLLRIGLHPRDVMYPETVAACQRLIGHLLDSREAMTQADYAETWRQRGFMPVGQAIPA